MVTMREVAKAAGVSVATVSRVLNSNGYVNEDTKKNVLQAIERLEYKPNSVARSLFKKQSRTIGLIVPDITNPFFPELARAVEDVTNDKGYTIILGNSDEKPSKERAYLDMMEQKYVDGIIIATNTLNYEQLQALKKPVVVIDRYIHADVPTVVVENYNGAGVAVDHLKASGCKVIAHIRGPVHVVNANERCQGYIDAVQKEPWYSPVYIVGGQYTIKDAYESTKQLLTDYPEVDGIFAGNDLMAIGAMKAARELGRQMPDDLSIIGFDGINMSETTFPELSTMVQPIYEIGEAAANLLIDLVEKKPITEKFFHFPVKLEERASTKPRKEITE